MLNLKGQNILILGLGESGLSMVRWCVFCGANVWVVDNRQEPPHLKTLRKELPQVQFICGSFEAGVLNAVPVKAVFKSPGLSPVDVEDLWSKAKELGLALGTELTLFALAMNELKAKCFYAPHVLSVTGTNGKTTVTSLTAALLERAQMKVAVAGNIGPALLDTLRTHLSSQWVEDLRRFDLEALERELLLQQNSELNHVTESVSLPESELREGLGQGQVAVQEEVEVGVEVEVHAQNNAQSPSTQDESELEPEPMPMPMRDSSSMNLENPRSDTADLEASSPTLGDSVSNQHEQTQSKELALDMEEAPQVVVPFEQLRAQHLLALFPWLAQMPNAWVLELSSFQLSGVSEFEATAATLLNITQDHLDWHVDMNDYAQAKGSIFGTMTTRILNRDDPSVMVFVPQPKERTKQAFGAKSKTKIATGPQWVEFGYGLPTRAGDFGVEQVNGMSWLVRALADTGLKIKKNQEAEELEIQRLMPVDALRIFGRHNASNALAALALASTTQAKLAPMLYALREYRGEPHRIQSVQIVNGVEYIDDSKGTNVGATVAALEGLGHERKLVLILGGDAKGQDFKPLLQPINRFARAVVLMGRDAQLIQEAISSVGVPLISAQSMQEAVQEASRVAKHSDAVLLSPACSSLDMYTNYAHRAQVFVDAVQELSEMGLQDDGHLTPTDSNPGQSNWEVQP